MTDLAARGGSFVNTRLDCNISTIKSTHTSAPKQGQLDGSNSASSDGNNDAVEDILDHLLGDPTFDTSKAVQHVLTMFNH